MGVTILYRGSIRVDCVSSLDILLNHSYFSDVIMVLAFVGQLTSVGDKPVRSSVRVRGSDPGPVGQ